jgi:hypothetical protein
VPHQSWTKTRSVLALTIRDHPEADTTDLRRQLKAERLAEHIAKQVESWPPLSPADRAHLARLLIGGHR